MDCWCDWLVRWFVVSFTRIVRWLVRWLVGLEGHWLTAREASAGDPVSRKDFPACEATPPWHAEAVRRGNHVLNSMADEKKRPQDSQDFACETMFYWLIDTTNG